MTRNHAIDDAAPAGRRSLLDLPGWAEDDHAAALGAYTRTLPGFAADPALSARAVLEKRFRAGPVIACHATGYFEPELPGAYTRSDDFPVPVHAVPEGGVSAPRAEIEGHLAGHELCWLQDEVDRFFLQVQGSGRVRLPDGSTLRLGYAGTNGQPYRSIGAILVARGELGTDVTADAVKSWLRSDPARGRALMCENPSYVMFRRLDIPPTEGPIGAMDHPVTAMRSIAVDPDFHELGDLFWLEVGDIRGLVVAQDTGSAIKGPGRVDLFHGTGEAAGRAAGRLNATGRLIRLVPR